MRLGGGAATIRQYMQAGLLDELHIALVPVLLGGGERVFDDLDGGPDGYECTEFVGVAVGRAHSPVTRQELARS